ncbi:MAG: PaaI family thioesterase [Rhizomicrobium sp.]
MPLSVFDRFAMPPCAALLGWHLIDADAAKGRVQVGFEARAEFCNGSGFVQGGFVSAMLDDTMGPAVLVASAGRAYVVTIGMQVQFLRAARPGRFTGEGLVLQLGKTVAFIEARLSDADGRLVATATSSARLMPIEKLAA